MPLSTIFPCLSCQRFRLHVTFAAALRGFFPGRGRVLHFQRDHFHAVTMFENMIGNRMFRPNRRGQNKRDLVLPHHITGAISHAGFRSAVGHRLKTERALVKMRRLLGVTDVKFDVICTLERQKIFLCRREQLSFLEQQLSLA